MTVRPLSLDRLTGAHRWLEAPNRAVLHPRDAALHRHLSGREFPVAEIADYACLVLRSFLCSVAHKFHERAVRIPKIDRGARPFCAKTLHRAAFYGNAVFLQMRYRVVNRSLPFKTQIA